MASGYKDLHMHCTYSYAICHSCHMHMVSVPIRIVSCVHFIAEWVIWGRTSRHRSNPRQNRTPTTHIRTDKLLQRYALGT